MNNVVLNIKTESNFENELKDLIKKEYNLTDDQTRTLSEKIIEECKNVPKEYEYRSPFGLTIPTKDFDSSKKFLELYNLHKEMYRYENRFSISNPEQIYLLKFVLIDESFGYVQCIANRKLDNSQLSELNDFIHDEYIIVNTLLSPLSDSGSEINTTDEVVFEEYLMDANKAIKDAFKNIKLYCAYTTCDQCIISKNQLPMIQQNIICPFALSLLNTDSEEE